MVLKRGQAAVEMILLLSGILLIVLFIIFLKQSALSSVNSQYEVSVARTTLDDLAAAAESVYRQGAGAKTIVYVTIPGSAVAAAVGNTTLSVTLQLGESPHVVYRNLGFEVRGNISSLSGSRWATVESFESYVEINANASVAAAQVHEEQAVNCTDGVKNQDESDIDCGGICGSTCTVSKLCNGDSDCATSYCNATESPARCRNTTSFITQSSLVVNMGSAALAGANKRIENIVLLNNGTSAIEVTGVKVLWIPASGEKIDKVKIDNTDRWDKSCNWGCTPSGAQLTGTALNFVSRNVTLSAGQSKTIDRIEFDSSMNAKSFMFVFTLNDSTTKTAFVSFSNTYYAVPETAFEEDNDPVWQGQLYLQNDSQYALAYDEDAVVPDYLEFWFPDLLIPLSKNILSAELGIQHRDDLAGGIMNEDTRHMIQCYNNGWNNISTFNVSATPATWDTYQSSIVSCVNTSAAANAVKIRMAFDPFSGTGGLLYADWAQISITTS
jgi:hypothetical protein